MDDDKKIPLGTESEFDEHELDLNTPEDLEAAEDLSFLENPTDDSTEIFDEFDDFTALDKMAATEDTAALVELEEPEAYPQADESQPEDPFAFGDEEAFDFSQKTDEDMFTSDAFEDINASDIDFPEEEASDKLGDSQLFDYEASSAGNEDAMQAEDIYSEAATAAAVASGSAGGQSGGGKGESAKSLFKNRRAMRVVLMLVLVGAVYGILRVFTSGSSMPDLQASAPVSVPKTAQAPEKIPEMISTPDANEPQAPATLTTPALEATPSTEVGAAPTIAVPGSQATTSEVATPPATAGVAAPTSAVSGVSAPQTSLTVASPAADNIAAKLSSLEASINAIDDRLSHISTGGARSPVSQVGQGANMGNPFGTPPPESQQILKDALHKIEGIDAKMSYLAELQTQVHILSKEVSALKGDVVQQSMIVGNSQAAINQSLSAAIDMKAPKMMVQAAIPGRAWLRSESGQLLTVIPGDEVAGYGRVVSIDPTTGTVVMSSRAVFREQ